MNKELKKLYISFIITLFSFIVIFPYLFININNGFDYAAVKLKMILNQKENTEVNIYSNRGNVIIMFDDGWKSQYTIRI